jgi:hypothetical protein
MTHDFGAGSVCAILAVKKIAISMKDEKQNPDPAWVPPRKWKQAEALRAIEILKAEDPEKWAEYVHQELNGAEIDPYLGRWMMNILRPIFNTNQIDVIWLFGKVRSNVNPIWEKDRKDDQ